MVFSREGRRAPYRFIQGLDFPAAIPAACSRWNFPPRGGVGLAAIAAFFSRRARWMEVSEGEAGWLVMVRL